jgi:hypothetical protein
MAGPSGGTVSSAVGTTRPMVKSLRIATPET